MLHVFDHDSQSAGEGAPGVIDAKVNYDQKTATVKYDADRTNPSALVKATTNAGFPSTVHSGGQSSDNANRDPRIRADLSPVRSCEQRKRCLWTHADSSINVFNATLSHGRNQETAASSVPTVQ